MRIARFVHREDFHYGVVQDDTITVLANDPLYAGIVPTTETLQLDDVRLVTPILPRSKVVGVGRNWARSEEHTSELQSRGHLVCRLLLEKKNILINHVIIL